MANGFREMLLFHVWKKSSVFQQKSNVTQLMYSRVPNKRTPPLIRNFQKNPKNWPNFGEKNQFSKKQKGSHENRMLEINELIILHIFHTFLYPR